MNVQRKRPVRLLVTNHHASQEEILRKCRRAFQARMSQRMADLDRKWDAAFKGLLHRES